MRQRLDGLVGRRQRERGHRVVKDRLHDLGKIHPEQERIDPAIDLDADRIDERERVEAVRRHHGDLGGDPSAEGRPDEMHPFDAQRIEQIEIVEREIGDVLDPFRRRRSAVPGMTREPDGEARGEARLERQPASRAARAVQEEQISPFAAAPHVNGRAAHAELLSRGLSRQ